jgi:nucleoid DNA-binding protein
VKRVIQQFLDEIVAELGKGNRLEFRDFGVFETKLRKARKAQNPKTLMPVAVPEKRTVKFKVGRLMKQRLADLTGGAFDNDGSDGEDESDDDSSPSPSESAPSNQPQPGA